MLARPTLLLPLVLAALLVPTTASPTHSRQGRVCGPHFCEDPPGYPAPLIRQLLTNSTLPKGLFDSPAPTRKRSIDLVKLLDLDIGHNSGDNAISNKLLKFK